MTRVAYFDCFAGASGDMILGALVAAGVPLDDLRAQLSLLPLNGYQLQETSVARRSLAATRVSVAIDSGNQRPRSLADVTAIIEHSELEGEIKSRSIGIFQRLAEAEGRVHGQAPEAVHFHDVGAIDAIIDVVGAVCGLRLLDIAQCYSSPLPLGMGSVASGHGVLPLPAPATLSLIEEAKAPTRDDPASGAGELTTPTGAAILTTLCRFERPPMKVLGSGYGAGARDPQSHANVLRLVVGEAERQSLPRMLLVETNIDDMSPEQLAYALEQASLAGAVDAWLTPIQMKKGRPGVLFSALCSPDAEDRVAAVILKETTTLGLRVQPVYRHEAARESLQFRSSLGDVGVKVRQLSGHEPLFAPEFEDCRRIALDSGVALRVVMEIVSREAAEEWARNNRRANDVSRSAD
jgi:pyridinium-3,5-bisthiocarboxylic acid mononucleotide nickel chelatase